MEQRVNERRLAMMQRVDAIEWSRAKQSANETRLVIEVLIHANGWCDCEQDRRLRVQTLRR